MSELHAEHSAYGWSVVDPDGGIWWPGPGADVEIEEAADPAECTLAICESQVMRGRWVA